MQCFCKALCICFGSSNKICYTLNFHILQKDFSCFTNHKSNILFLHHFPFAVLLLSLSIATPVVFPCCCSPVVSSPVVSSCCVLPRCHGLRSDPRLNSTEINERERGRGRGRGERGREGEGGRATSQPPVPPHSPNLRTY